MGYSGVSLVRLRLLTAVRGSLTIREYHVKLEEAPLPQCFVLAGDAALPLLQIKHAICGSGRSCKETKGMFFSPLLP